MENQVVNSYKKLSEMTVDELRALAPMTFGIYQVEKKKQRGSYNYSAVVEIMPGLQFNFFIEQSQFFLLEHFFEQRPGLPSYTRLHGTYRISMGKRNDGTEFYFLEAVLSKDIVESVFLTDSQVLEVKVLYPKLPIEDRTKIPASTFVALGVVPDLGE